MAEYKLNPQALNSELGGVMVIDTSNTSTEYWKGIYDAVMSKYYNIFVVEADKCYSANMIVRNSELVSIKHNYVQNGVLVYHAHNIYNTGKYSSNISKIELSDILSRLDKIEQQLGI